VIDERWMSGGWACAWTLGSCHGPGGVRGGRDGNTKEPRRAACSSSGSDLLGDRRALGLVGEVRGVVRGDRWYEWRFGWWGLVV
jgi:hypothetical protein